jgi:hypothetical protein
MNTFYNNYNWTKLGLCLLNENKTGTMLIQVGQPVSMGTLHSYIYNVGNLEGTEIQL